MESSTAPYRKVAALIVMLASLALLSGGGSTKLLLGKRNDPPAEKVTELASRAAEKPTSNDSNQVVRAGYQQDGSQSEVALASATLNDRAPVVHADAHMQIDPISLHPSTGTVQHVGTKDFEQQVLNSEVPVLVDFYADWCGPCKKLAPTLDRIASDTPNAKVVKVNIDDSPKIAKKYGVSSIPTVIVFKNGSLVARNTGVAKQDKLMEMLAQ
jgi:thioredoxin 1